MKITHYEQASWGTHNKMKQEELQSMAKKIVSSCSSGLTSITIPDSVTSIGSSTFEGCSGLTSITFNGTKAQWNAISKGYHWNTIPATIRCIARMGTFQNKSKMSY